MPCVFPVDLDKSWLFSTKFKDRTVLSKGAGLQYRSNPSRERSPTAAGLNIRENDGGLRWALRMGDAIHWTGERHATRKRYRHVRPQPFRFVGDHGARTDLIAQYTLKDLGAKALPNRRAESSR